MIACGVEVKILYVRNLMLSTSEETLENIFNQAVGHCGAVERVKKIKDYAFVHFHDRNDALRALNVLNSMYSFQCCPDVVGRLLVSWLHGCIVAKQLDRSSCPFVYGPLAT